MEVLADTDGPPWPGWQLWLTGGWWVGRAEEEAEVGETVSTKKETGLRPRVAKQRMRTDQAHIKMMMCLLMNF